MYPGLLRFALSAGLIMGIDPHGNRERALLYARWL